MCTYFKLNMSAINHQASKETLSFISLVNSKTGSVRTCHHNKCLTVKEHFFPSFVPAVSVHNRCPFVLRACLRDWTKRKQVHVSFREAWQPQVVKALPFSCGKLLSSGSPHVHGENTVHRHQLCGICMCRGWFTADRVLFWADQCWFCGGGTALFCHFLTASLLRALSIKHAEILCPCCGLLPSLFLSFVFRGWLKREDDKRSDIWLLICSPQTAFVMTRWTTRIIKIPLLRHSHNSCADWCKIS